MDGLAELNWLWIVFGVALGVGGIFGAICLIGRRTARRWRLGDRGDCDRPLPEPFRAEQVVAVYKRRKSYHQHDRHYYRRKESEARKKADIPTASP